METKPKSPAEWLYIAHKWAIERLPLDDAGAWNYVASYLAGELSAMEMKCFELEKKYEASINQD